MNKANLRPITSASKPDSDTKAVIPFVPEKEWTLPWEKFETRVVDTDSFQKSYDKLVSENTDIRKSIHLTDDQLDLFSEKGTVEFADDVSSSSYHAKQARAVFEMDLSNAEIHDLQLEPFQATLQLLAGDGKQWKLSVSSTTEKESAKVASEVRSHVKEIYIILDSTSAVTVSPVPSSSASPSPAH